MHVYFSFSYNKHIIEILFVEAESLSLILPHNCFFGCLLIILLFYEALKRLTDNNSLKFKGNKIRASNIFERLEKVIGIRFELKKVHSVVDRVLELILKSKNILIDKKIRLEENFGLLLFTN